ncbi:MAG: GT-D fold domain-containing glycosyltransferase [Nanoarchaeota archaeon]
MKKSDYPNLREYPEVIHEFVTLDLIREGYSIGRYGDGEFKLMNGKDCVSQKFDKRLHQELISIAKFGNTSKFLVGIPNIHSDTAKKDFWWPFIDKFPFKKFIDKKYSYASSFITRPDSAQWIDTIDYWKSVKLLWKDKHVVLVRGSEKSLLTHMFDGASSVHEILTPRQHSYEKISEIELDIISSLIGKESEPKIIILCCGATATVLAYKLSMKSYHAVDLGHLGMFLKRKDLKEVNERI